MLNTRHRRRFTFSFGEECEEKRRMSEGTCAIRWEEWGFDWGWLSPQMRRVWLETSLGRNKHVTYARKAWIHGGRWHDRDRHTYKNETKMWAEFASRETLSPQSVFIARIETACKSFPSLAVNSFITRAVLWSETSDNGTDWHLASGDDIQTQPLADLTARRSNHSTKWRALC